MSPFLGLAKHGACQSFKTEHNYKTVKSLIISKPTQLIWKQLRGVVKNRYFTVRLTVRVDPPLRSAFWWFFLVCAKTLFWALFCGSKFSHLLYRDGVKKRIFYGQAVCLSVDPALPYRQVLSFLVLFWPLKINLLLTLSWHDCPKDCKLQYDELAE